MYINTVKIKARSLLSLSEGARESLPFCVTTSSTTFGKMLPFSSYPVLPWLSSLLYRSSSPLWASFKTSCTTSSTVRHQQYLVWSAAMMQTWQNKTLTKPKWKSTKQPRKNTCSQATHEGRCKGGKSSCCVYACKSHFPTTKLKVCLTTGHVVGEGVKKGSITIWYIILQLLWIQTGIFYPEIKSQSLDITWTGKAQ